jgi:hypothetical protein
MAHLVRNELEQRGFHVFMDVIDIDNGQFEPTILSEIQTRKHFLILLEPGSLDRIRDPDDWLCREIAHALQHRRNVVPLLANGAQMPRAMDLPEEIASLSSFNAVPVPHDYFLEAMARLCNRFIGSNSQLSHHQPPSRRSP